ncbi:MAG TPA: cytochrome c-type biogenesis CcmF C-terminal domain-containing protein [Polyangia bacterium]|jgi:cytochrome c-type biogenesis protein CcmF
MAGLSTISSFGTVILALTLVVTVYSAVAAATGARRLSRRLVRSAEAGLYGVLGLLAVASGLMIYAFLSHDFSIKYVHHYSDSTMPLWYLITSYWGGLDGSLLFWAFLLALFGAVAVRFNRERHREMLPWIIVVLQAVMAFFLFLLVFERNPFGPYIPGAELPRDGRGLNPLLQNAYMVTHPPSLYLGFVGMTIPFAFGMAALISGRLDESWLLSIRRWVIVSWFFLSTGLILGMLWAYEELGWGGYWAWDPVENAALIPWLTATALLHSVMVQERRGMLKVWNVTLVIMTFFLTIMGTFMTRSGVVQSVHAFGQDTRLALIFGTFMFLILVVAFGLVIWRLLLLKSRSELDSVFSREAVFLVNNWILLFAALFVLGATLWPTIAEMITGHRATMGALFFNKWMTPIGLILLFLTGVGPLIPWRRATPASLVRQFLWPAAGALALLAIIVGWDWYRAARFGELETGVGFVGHLVARFRDIGLAPLIDFGLAGFVLGSVVQELWRGSGVRAKSLGVDRFTALIGLIARGKRRYGGYLVHASIALMFIGFGGEAFKRDLEASMRKGQDVQFAGYGFKLDEVAKTTDAQKEMVTATMTVTKNGAVVRRMAPGKWTYFKHDEQPTTEVDIWRQAGKDVYIILSGYELGSGQAMLKIVINPLVNWVWIGFLLLFLGTFIALFPDRVLERVAEATGEAGPPSRAAKGGAAAAVVLALLLGGAGVAVAQGAMPPPAPLEKMDHSAKARITSRSPLEAQLFRRIVCMCDTCPRLPLSDCGCGFAEKERNRISRMLNVEHKTEADVIGWYMEKYGQAALGAPVEGLGRWAWLIMYGAGGGAILGVIVLALRWRRAAAAAAAAAPAAAAPTAGVTRYEEKLDDELRDLD